MGGNEEAWVEKEVVAYDFRDEDLSRLRTERAVFDECDFRGVDLRGARLQKTRLEESDLRGARTDATFWTTATLRGATIDIDLGPRAAGERWPTRWLTV